MFFIIRTIGEELCLSHIYYIIIYILALLYIGSKDHATEDKDGFIIANRKVGVIGTLSSISAGFRTGGGLMVLIGSGFTMAYGLYHIGIGILIGSLILQIVAPKARAVAKKKNYITINQMVKDSIGIKTEKASAFIVLVFAVLGIAAQFYVLGKISMLFC